MDSHTKQEKRHLHVYVGTISCQVQPLQCPYWSIIMCRCTEVCLVFMVSSGQQILFPLRMYFIQTNQKGCQPFIILIFNLSKNMTLQIFNFKKMVFHGIWSVQWSYLIAFEILLGVGYVVVGQCLMTDCYFHLWSLALAMYLKQANTKVSSQITT